MYISPIKVMYKKYNDTYVWISCHGIICVPWNITGSHHRDNVHNANVTQYEKQEHPICV